MDWKRIAREFVIYNLILHPLPWRLERDWCSELTASDGHIIVKDLTPDEADEVIKLAQEINQELKETEAGLLRMIEG